jgi:hypothetical protein
VLYTAICRDFVLERTDFLAKHKLLGIDHAHERSEYFVANGSMLSFEIEEGDGSLFCGKTHTPLS